MTLKLTSWPETPLHQEKTHGAAAVTDTGGRNALQTGVGEARKHSSFPFIQDEQILQNSLQMETFVEAAGCRMPGGFQSRLELMESLH